MLLLLALACATEAPAPLPPQAAAPPAVELRRVKYPGVEGQIARPSQGTPTVAVLLLVDQLDHASEALDRREAEEGRIALAIAPDVEQTRARDYLEGIPGVAQVQTRCLRRDCPERAP